MLPLNRLWRWLACYVERMHPEGKFPSYWFFLWACGFCVSAGAFKAFVRERSAAVKGEELCMHAVFAHAAQLLVMSWMQRSATIVLLIWVDSGAQADFCKLPPASGPAALACNTPTKAHAAAANKTKESRQGRGSQTANIE